MPPNQAGCCGPDAVYPLAYSIGFGPGNPPFRPARPYASRELDPLAHTINNDGHRLWKSESSF
jgi:hypothetical protein